MREKLNNKYDLPLPFMIVVMAVVLFLSGCNLNNGSKRIEATEPSVVPSRVITPQVTESVDVEAESSTVSYQAGVIQAFDQQKFDAALADGKTVFLDFYASWCPTCRANEPIVDAAFDGSVVIAFRVDYDNATELRKKYSVVSQSTYIVLRGDQELNRYLGALTTDKMASLLEQ